MMDINNSDYKNESPCDHHDNKPLLTEDNKPDDIVVSKFNYVKFKLFCFWDLFYNKQLLLISLQLVCVNNVYTNSFHFSEYSSSYSLIKKSLNYFI